jgi:hypothetical protein
MDEIRKLTRMGGDVRKIAALLQSKGRGRDTILAHITPQEAALLKSRGGRGSTNPDTGLLEFEDDVGAIEDYQTPAPGEAGPPPETYTPPEQEMFYGQPAPQQAPISEPVTSPIYSDYGAGLPGAGAPGTTFTTPGYAAAQEQVAPEAVKPDQGLADKVSAATGLSKDALARALGVTVQGLSTALLTRRAQREAGAARAETERLGAPYRAKAQELMSQAQAGQLTPVGQQAIEAARARMAQATAGRGGVGAAQQATQLEAFRQQLLQQQYDLGVKLAGVADQFALRAIQQGLTADQQVNQMLSQSMSNIGAIFAGSARPQVPGGQ